MITTEQEIIELIRTGNSDAFKLIVESYQKPVYNLCFRMLGDPYEAEDAAQETFIRALKNIKRYDTKRSFSTWLLSIAAHYCIDQLRKRRINFLSTDDSPLIALKDKSLGPESEVILNEEQIQVRNLLKLLNPTDRAAVIMYYWYDFSYEEIARSLSLTISAVKSRLHRSRQALAEGWLARTSQNIQTEGSRYESPAF